MEVPAITWDRYIAMLRKINNKAAADMKHYLESVEWWVSNESRAEAVEFAYGLATKYGEASSAVACEMYDLIARETATGIAPAIPAETATYREVAKTVYGTMKTENIEIISSSVGKLAKLAGVDTTVKNAIRDRAEWAWIPRGDTCAFCLTLASQGWQAASTKILKGGHAEHVHANCDCMFMTRFNRNTNVAGYNPDKYLRMYYDAPTDKAHPTGKDRINALRRQMYAETGKEEIDV